MKLDYLNHFKYTENYGANLGNTHAVSFKV